MSGHGLAIFTQYGKLLALLVGTMLFMALVVSPFIIFVYLHCNPYPLVLRCLRESGLTAFLTTQAGVNSGFMIVQYAAASMVSENKVYAHPASVDSIPSSANQEDIVSMGTTAARKAKMILQNTQDVLADELLTACQAIDIRRRLNTHGQGLTPLHEAIYQHVRKEVAFYEVDREIWPDIRAVEKMIRSGELLDIVKEYIPDFE